MCHDVALRRSFLRLLQGLNTASSDLQRPQDSFGASGLEVLSGAKRQALARFANSPQPMDFRPSSAYDGAKSLSQS